MRVLLLLALFLPLFSQSPSLLISDYDFTNQKYNYSDTTNFMIKHFPKCLLTASDVRHMVSCGYISQINILVILAKIQQEQGLIEMGNTNKYQFRYETAMGVRLYSFHTKKPREKYRGFRNQVTWGCKILRWNFEDYEYGNEILLEDGDIKLKHKKVWPQNAATYSLYIYCPSYGVVTGHPWTQGREFTGNSVFVNRFNDYKGKWVKMYGSF